MQNEAKRLRVFDIARAFHLIAMQPEKALSIIDAFPDWILKAVEEHFAESVVKSFDDEPLAVAIGALMSHPFVRTSPTTIDVTPGTKDADAPFEWTKQGERGAKDVSFNCDWNGLDLRIVKRAPADYEGFIDGEKVARAKFKKNLRERVEKEAAKLVAA